MPKFTVTETVPCVQIWTYEVEATNEVEALAMIVQGKVQASKIVVDEHDYDETHYEVEDSE